MLCSLRIRSFRLSFRNYPDPNVGLEDRVHESLLPYEVGMSALDNAIVHSALIRSSIGVTIYITSTSRRYNNTQMISNSQFHFTQLKDSILCRSLRDLHLFFATTWGVGFQGQHASASCFTLLIHGLFNIENSLLSAWIQSISTRHSRTLSPKLHDQLMFHKLSLLWLISFNCLELSSILLPWFLLAYIYRHVSHVSSLSDV